MNDIQIIGAFVAIGGVLLLGYLIKRLKGK